MAWHTALFFYDADTNTFSNISIRTSNGGSLTGSDHAIARNAGSTARQIWLLTDPTGTVGWHNFPFTLAGAMTNTGGYVYLTPTAGLEGPCVKLLPSTTSCDGISRARTVINGAIFSYPYPPAPVPLPGALWLFDPAFFGMAALGRRKADLLGSEIHKVRARTV